MISDKPVRRILTAQLEIEHKIKADHRGTMQISYEPQIRCSISCSELGKLKTIRCNFSPYRVQKIKKKCWLESQNRHLYTSRWHFMKKGNLYKFWQTYVSTQPCISGTHPKDTIMPVDISEERCYHKIDCKSKGCNDICAHQWRTGYINTVEYQGNKKNEAELYLLYLISKIIQNISWDEKCRTEKNTVICSLCGKPQTVAYIIPSCMRILNSFRSGEGYQGV